MDLVVIFPFPPRLPVSVSEFPKYKKDVLRWSRLSGVTARVQGDVILDSIPWDHPWKESLERAVGDKVTNNKKNTLLKIDFRIYELCNRNLFF